MVDEQLRRLLVSLHREAGWLEALLDVVGDDGAGAGVTATLAKSLGDTLRAVVNANGWPDEAVAGREGAAAALALLMAAEPDRSFLERCRGLVAAAVSTGRLAPWHLACIEDRIAVVDGRPQRYGTRLRRVDGRPEPHPIEDPQRVDDRRAEIGLPPLADALAIAGV